MTALFLLVLIGVGCKKENDPVGLGLQPEDQLLGVNQTDTLTIIASTIEEDSLRADELSQTLIGSYYNPQTGETNASFYSQLRLSTPDIDFGSNPVADSLVISFKYTGEFWGELQTQQFEIFRMTEGMEVDSAYYTDTEFEVDPINLIEAGDENKQFKLSESIILEDDSVGPQLRFRLSADLANELIGLDADTYDSNDNWTEYFKGIYVRSNSFTGGIAHLDLIDGESLMRLHYHNDTDTSFFDYVINSVTGRVNIFDQTPGGDLIGLNAQESVDGTIQNFVQAGSGYKTQIAFPFLDELNKIEGRTVNKAELIIPVSEPEDPRFSYQDLLFLLTENEEGNAVGLPGQVSSIISIGGNYESFGNQYRFNITRWVQSYLNGDQAVNFVNMVSSNGSISSKTVGVNGPGVSTDDPTQNMRLILTYSN